MSKHFLTLCSVLFLSMNLTAQSLSMKLADSYMKRFDYKAAIDIYEKILEKETQNTEAQTKLADCYKKIKDTKQAEYWYSQAVASGKIEPIYYLSYAQMLQRNGKCNIAKQWFQRYAKAFPDDLRGQHQAKSCDYAQELLSKNEDLYEVKRLWFNSTGDDFSPTFYKDGLVFTSDRYEEWFIKKSSGWGEKPFLKLFQLRMAPAENSVSTTCNYIYTKPKLIEKPINSSFHDASAVYSADGQEIFFTRSGAEPSLIGGVKTVQNLQLYYSRIMRGEWIEPIRLPFNEEHYSVAHPALSADGRFLFFASDMPGGYGGMDLYMVERIQNRWGIPINLGRQVNTEGEEVFPTCDKSGRLYFASDGHIGLGGLDIYFTELLDANTWSIPENIGAPINSFTDDFGIIFNSEGTCGYFASNRLGGIGGDDIYSFVKNAVTVQIIVYDKETKKPLTNSIVQEDCNSNTFATNGEGKVVFDMLLNKCCTFRVDMEGYESGMVKSCMDYLTPGETVTIEIPMQAHLTFSVTGILFNEYTGLPIANAKVTLKNDCAIPLERMETDASGRFTFALKEHCCYTLEASHRSYANTVQSTYCTRGLKVSQNFSSKLYLNPSGKERGK